MNRTQFQKLTVERVHDAEALLGAGRWSGAYYLAGYAAECALKACIAKLTKRYDFPDKDRVSKSYTHNIENLLHLAGLRNQRDRDILENPEFGRSWAFLKDWDEQARYLVWTQKEAREFFAAVTDDTKEVLPWIMVRW